MNLRSPWFLIAVLLAISGCNSYGSRLEARNACQKWASKGGSYVEHYSERDYSFATKKYEEKRVEEKKQLRRCLTEDRTDQLLGLEMTALRDGDKVPRDFSRNYGEQVIKRFRY